MGDQIVKVINALAEKTGIVVDWSSKNVFPEVKTAILNAVQFDVVSHFVFSSVWLLIACAFVIGAIKIIKYANKTLDCDDETFGACIVSAVICIIIGLFFVPAFIIDLNIALKGLIAPELRAFEMIQELINVNK